MSTEAERKAKLESNKSNEEGTKEAIQAIVDNSSPDVNQVVKETAAMSCTCRSHKLPAYEEAWWNGLSDESKGSSGDGAAAE